MKLYSFKKFNKKEVTLKERKNLKDMELGLDLTKDKSDKYIMKKQSNI